MNNIPKAVTKTDISRAFVKPGQCPYEVAIANHNRDESVMRAQRTRLMKDWKANDADEVIYARRQYLDKVKQSFLLSENLSVFNLENMMESMFAIAEEDGDEAAKVFAKERDEYEEMMYAHEKKWDFEQLQKTYRDARNELMLLSNFEMDAKMKKINKNWKGYNDLFTDQMDKEHDLCKCQEENIRLKKLVKDLTDRCNSLEKHICDHYKDDMEAMVADYEAEKAREVEDAKKEEEEEDASKAVAKKAGKVVAKKKSRKRKKFD